MKFLIDVNASRSLGNRLIAKGYDVAYVGDVEPKMVDEDILAWAVQEQRVIVTTDNDFEQMIWQQQKPHCGILRLENIPRKEREVLLNEALQHHSQDLLEGKIVKETPKKLRRVQEKIDKLTVVVIDNAPIHTSKAFQQKIAGWRSQKLEIFWLPTYSPQLNLIENLWRFRKYEWIEKEAYSSWKNLVEYVENILKDFGTKYTINFA